MRRWFLCTRLGMLWLRLLARLALWCGARLALALERGEQRPWLVLASAWLGERFLRGGELRRAAVAERLAKG